MVSLDAQEIAETARHLRSHADPADGAADPDEDLAGNHAQGDGTKCAAAQCRAVRAGRLQNREADHFVIFRPSCPMSAAVHPPQSAEEIHTFTDTLTPDLGVALMNLHLHGRVDVNAANQLRYLRLAAPTTFSRRIPGAGVLSFEALELDLSGYLEIGRIDQGRAIRHRFVQDAYTRMTTDQFAGAAELVFESSYLERLAPEFLAGTHKLSAQSWQR